LYNPLVETIAETGKDRCNKVMAEFGIA